MNCNKAERFINMSIDDELEPSLEQELTTHIESCAHCRREYDQARQFKTLVREKVRRISAPAHLKPQIQAALRETEITVPRRERAWDLIDRHPRHIAGALAAMLLAAFLLIYMQSDRSPHPPALIIELTEHHADCEIQIASAQPDEIKDWFRQSGFTLPVAVPSRDELDYELLGAHLCRMLHRDAAYMVYKLDDGEVSICCIEDEGLELDALGPIEFDKDGFYAVAYEGRNLVLWRDSGALYVVVGQAEQDDLLAIAAKTRKL